MSSGQQKLPMLLVKKLLLFLKINKNYIFEIYLSHVSTIKDVSVKNVTSNFFSETNGHSGETTDVFPERLPCSLKKSLSDGQQDLLTMIVKKMLRQISQHKICRR